VKLLEAADDPEAHASILAHTLASRDPAAGPCRPRSYTTRVDRKGWNRRYLEQELLWSAEPNRFLVEEVGTRRRLVENGQGAVYEIDCLVRARFPR
jgi:hypothetical protein